MKLDDLDNKTLWRLMELVKATKKPKSKPAASRAQQIERALANTTAKSEHLRAGIQNLGGGGAGASGGAGGGGSPSDSGSDVGSYLPEGGAMWDEFAESQQQHDQQKQQAAMDSAGRAREQAGAVQREREAERAAERASREQGGGVDMLDQSNIMASFQVCPP